MPSLKSPHQTITPKHLIYSILAIVFSLVLNGCDSNKPQTERSYKIGIIHSGKRFAPFIEEFKQEMGKHGYKEGQNTTFIYDGPTSADQVIKRLKFLKKQDLDLLYTITTPVTAKARRIFSKTGTPIVFGPVFSPIEAGITDSLTRPNKNMTGVMIRGCVPKAFGLLKETMPSLKNISAPFPAEEKAARLSLKDLQDNTEKFEVKVSPVKIQSKADLENYLRHIPNEADVIWALHSPFIMNNFDIIIAAANAKKIPVASATLKLNNGILISYGPEMNSIIKQVARLADKRIQGIPAEKLPIEHCEYRLAIDLKTANHLGIKIPDNVLRQAELIHRN